MYQSTRCARLLATVPEEILLGLQHYVPELHNSLKDCRNGGRHSASENCGNNAAFLAEVCCLLGSCTLASTLYQVALEHAEDRRLETSWLMSYANCLQTHLGRFAEAKQIIEKLLAVSGSDNFRQLLNLSNCCLQLGQHSEAEALFEYVLDHGVEDRNAACPMVAICHQGLGVIFYASGLMFKAEEHLKKAYQAYSEKWDAETAAWIEAQAPMKGGATVGVFSDRFYKEKALARYNELKQVKREGKSNTVLIYSKLLEETDRAGLSMYL